jgi:ubiquinone/menaquinone biosynthesis C-methylase UbiE
LLRELAHFVRHGPAVAKLQRQLGRAEFFDRLTAVADAKGYAEVRRELAGGLRGRVLEVGCGTGRAFAHYGPGVEVDAIEPDAEFRELAVRRGAEHPHVSVSDGDAMQLAFPDRSFDAALVSLVLCSVPSVERVVAEIHRVLRPGGELRALEHVRSERRIGGALMDLVNPVWLRLNKQGCNLNRRPLPAIEAAGFAIEDVRAFQCFDTPMPAFPMQLVRARRRG